MIQSIIGRIWVKFSLLRLPLILWFLFSGVWYGVYAQDSGQGIFSPFVSQLTAEVRNNLVRLSWTDSRDARGPVYIFRSVRPFDPNGVAGIRPIVIPYGTQYYVDETEGEGEGYYFVAASDTNGQRYDIIIPFTNTVSAGTAEFPWNDSNTPAAASRQNPWSPQSQAPDISGLNVYADGGRAIISFTASGSAGKTVLYRNTQPIRRIQDLLSAVIVQTDGNSPLMDFPIPGTYYYAVFFQDDITKGTVAIKPGQNTTLNPVAIAGVNPPAPPEIRAMPLPVMNVPAPEDKAPAQQPNPAPQFLQTPQVAQAPQDMQTVQIAQTPQNSPAAQTQKRPRVFARDLLAPSG
ncbi:MAG: hypothetical protein FWF29_11255, partial [Treponema sp.]|nr:hypothetical protein [Treponema sp.]